MVRCKIYKSKQEKIEAFKKAVGLRERWERAVDQNMTREEMLKIGIKAVPVVQ